MTDKANKILLIANALLLGGILWRSVVVPPVQAQTPSSQAPAIMTADKGTVYILQNGKLSVYWYDPDTAETSALAGKFTKGKMRLLTTQEVR